MKLFGFEITRAEKAAPQSIDTRGGWYPLVREPFGGAWQRNVTINQDSVLAYDALFACMTLIASDVSKNRVKLVAQQEGSQIWAEVENAAFSPVLRKPNRFQTHIQFFENWVLSKLMRGNTYALKQRDNRGVVVAMYILDPQRCKPMVTPDGEVYYQLMQDNLAGLEEAQILVPSSEIIHDRFNCLFHPLVGVSPIYASGLAATQGMKIEENSVNLFGNGARPGGLLVAPGKINPEDAERLKEYWDTKFTGENAGRVAVLGDGLSYQSLSLNATDAQLIEQLKWTAEVVCSTFHVPPYKIGVGTMPTYNNIQALNVEYYSQCLQVLFEQIEACLDDGLGIGRGKKINGTVYGTEFDVENLLRMDSVTQMEVLDKGKNLYTPNEARAKLELPPTVGGDVVYRQQQDYSLAALSKRDAKEDPFGSAEPAPQEPEDADTDGDEMNDQERLQRREANRALLEKRVRELMNV